MKQNHQQWKSNALIALLLVAVGLIYVAESIPIPAVVIYLGLMLLGAVTIYLGVDDIRQRRSGFHHDDIDATETYTGFGAIVWGLFFILLGLAMIGVGLVLVSGSGEALFAFWQRRPGSALIMIGLFAVLYSIPNILGSLEERRSMWRMLLSIPKRFVSVIVVLIGLALIAMGAWETVNPAAFDALLAGFTQDLPQ